MIIFHIGIVIKGDDLGSGFRSNTLRDGGSVASASAANVSWNRFTHMSCTAVRTDCSLELATDETNASPTEVNVMVIWNCEHKMVSIPVAHNGEIVFPILPAEIS